VTFKCESVSMKNLVVTISFGLITASAQSMVWQSDGTPQNIQFIHNNQAVDGDTITIPSGTFSWTGTVLLTKAITLQGNTTTDAPNSQNSVDNTVVIDNIPLAANNGLIELRAPGGQRVTGITFVQGRAQMQSNGIVRVSGATPTRIDHCVFDRVYFSPMIGVKDYNYGVIDHNVKRNPVSNEGLVHFTMGWTAQTNGDPPWVLPAGYGGPDFFFVEDNLSYGGMDLTLGSKVVVRHNVFMYANMASHGTGMSFTNGRGARAVEVYNNHFQLALGYQAVTGSNGGGALFHDNTIMPYPGYNVYGIDFGNYRQIANFGYPFGGANGANQWDLNDPNLYDSGMLTDANNNYPYTVTDSTKNWTPNQWAGYSIGRPSDGASAIIVSNSNNTLTINQWISQNFAAGNGYEIRKVLRALDQPGLGAQTGAMDRTHPRWMQQADEPCYEWNNFGPNNTPIHFIGSGHSTSILLGRDYFNETVKPGYTPYCYPHPLVSGVPCGGPSPTPTPTPTAGPTPVAPSDLTATMIDCRTIQLDWTDNSDNEDGFKLEESFDGGIVYYQFDDVDPDIVTYTGTNYAPNSPYFFRIRAFNGSGNSPYSNIANVFLPACSPTPTPTPTATATATPR
jgi:hypothetical protein